MSTSKKIDIICIVVTVAALVLTLIFMNGKAIGLVEAEKENQETDSNEFTANDLNDAPDTDSSTIIELNGNIASVEGNGAYFANNCLHIVYAGTYVLSGQLDGNIVVKADGDDKIWLVFDGLSINCDSDAGLRIEQADKVFINLKEGSINTISCGKNYDSTLVKDGVDGALFSRDDLTINGSGTLNINTEYKHGIVCNDTLKITNGNINVNAAEDGIHVNDELKMKQAALTVSAGDDGITVSNDKEEGEFYMESGTINVTQSYEGIEAYNIIVKGGDIIVNSSDDGFNAKGTGKEQGVFIYDGNIRLLNNSGRDADGLDSNGSVYIYGGNVFINVSQSSGYALDTGTETGGVCVISGGTVIACGGSGMAESFGESSTQCSFRYNLTEGQSDGSSLIITAADGTSIINTTIPYSFNSVVFSSPELKKGQIYKLTCGSFTGDIELTSMSTSLGTSAMGAGKKPGGMEFQKGDRNQKGNMGIAS